jgi:hypothetical protein
MTQLRQGELFVGPDGKTVYRVLTPCAKHPRGWLAVRNLSMTPAEAKRLKATPGAVEPGADPQEGVFTYRHPTTVHQIV